MILINFIFISIIMPYGNFDDNYATRLLYNQQQNQDPDLDIGEFVFEKLLYVGRLFDYDDDEQEHNAIPLKDPQPVPALQIQAGFYECYKPVIKVLALPQKIEKPSCIFRENKFSREFSPSVFHPPAQIG